MAKKLEVNAAMIGEGRTDTTGNIINIYCDESCHLENDHQPVMVLGAVWCPKDRVAEISHNLRQMRIRHGLKPTLEMKWTKVSPGDKSRAFYLDVVDYFFDEPDLHFRALIVPDKSILKHENFKQTHDDWYYKMMYDMLIVLIAPELRYHIYLDYKDTWGGAKIKKLKEVLANAKLDFNHKIIERVALVRSDEVQLIQLADLLIGAVGYVNRNLQGNTGKLVVTERIKQRSGYLLTGTTLYKENKVNLLRWQGRECRYE